MTEITAHFCIVTPLFLGGADNKSEAELRPASIKGALRFWWRALRWGKGVTDVGELKKKEDRLFGSSEVTERKDATGKAMREGGQAKFLLALETQCQPTMISADQILGASGKVSQGRQDIVGEGARYLGYGLMGAFGQNGGKLSRPCIAAPFEFTVRLAFKRSVGTTDIAEVADALKLLGLCGGLGSRSRRGWGSVTLTEIKDGMNQEVWRAPKTLTEYETKIREIIGGQKNGLPEWTAFAAGHSRIVLLQDKTNAPLETLAQMGRDFVLYRGWGHNGKVLGLPREGNFPFDHDLFKKTAPNRNTHPQRIVFGLPQNYGKTERDQVVPAGEGLDRRASPLFFHVHQVEANDPPIGVLVYLPARFLPAGKSMVTFGGRPIAIGQNGGIPFWQPAENFLKRIKDGSDKVRFVKTMEAQL